MKYHPSFAIVFFSVGAYHFHAIISDSSIISSISALVVSMFFFVIIPGVSSIPHGSHDPPQSTPVSSPFMMPS